MVHNGIAFESTGDVQSQILKLAKAIDEADAIVVGAGETPVAYWTDT